MGGNQQSKLSSEPVLKSVVIYNATDSDNPIIIPQLEPKNRDQASQTSRVPFQSISVQTDSKESQNDASNQTDLLHLTETSVQASVDTATVSVQTSEAPAQDSATQTSIPSSVRSKQYTESTSKHHLTFTIQKITFRREKGTPPNARVKEPDNEAEVKWETASNNPNQPTEEVSDVIMQIKHIRNRLQTALKMSNNNGDIDLTPSSVIEKYASPFETKDLPRETITIPTCMHAKTETTEEPSITDQNIMPSSSIDAQDLVTGENMPQKDPSPSISSEPTVPEENESTVQDMVGRQNVPQIEDQPILPTACLKIAPGNSGESSKELPASADPQEGSSKAQLVPEESAKPTKEKKRSAWKRMRRALTKPLRRLQSHTANSCSFLTPTCLKGTSSTTSRELLPSAEPKEGSSNGQLSQPIAPTTPCLKSPSEAASGNPKDTSSSAKQVPQKDEESPKKTKGRMLFRRSKK